MANPTFHQYDPAKTIFSWSLLPGLFTGYAEGEFIKFMRAGKLWIRVFPDKPISQKPAEVRMGNGKGNPEYYVAEIQPGKIVFEIVGVTEELAREAFRLAAAKLPLRTTFVARMIGQ